MKHVVIIFLATVSISSFSQTTVFERSGGKETPAYFEIIQWWKKLDEQSGKLKLLTMGMTDAGLPLHLAVVSNNGDHNFQSIRRNNKRVILVNNGIHPGEPDGIDASMLLARDIVNNKYKIPDNLVLAFIPVYNIGGCLNRGSNYRVDQDGPEEFGSRGNSQNLDLNRDFIKSDSKDSKAFAEIFHLTDPDVFVDNHVSNGADYQHVMTMVSSQHAKLGGLMGEFMKRQFTPGLHKLMKEKNFEMIPYVNYFGDKPENGWASFWDSPRYSSGYAALWQCFSFVPETHMLKPYERRVQATYALMQSFIEFTARHGAEIKMLREHARKEVAERVEFPIRWTLDRSHASEFHYKGFTSTIKTSEVSGLPRLYYDRNRPFETMVKLYDHYIPTLHVKKPAAYVIPQGWWKVIELLQLNKVKMQALMADTSIEVEIYKIDDYRSTTRQYEMHHPNSEVKISMSVKKMKFRKGDWLIPMNQIANRFLIETLEPQAEDSYFSWNFFDAILGQKEGFSAYAFEDKAADYLKNNPDLRAKLDQRKSVDTAFANSARSQLNFVYENSPWFEPEYLRYPVYRIPAK